MAKFLDLEGLNYFWEKIKSWVQGRFAYKSDLNQKQDKLRSGQNIKTINGYNITGPGNIEIESGAVDSVNGKTGNVVLSANDVGALPNTTDIPTKVSDLTNDSSFSSVSIDRKVSTGTNIADITIDGTTTQLYAPTSGSGGGEENIIETVKVNGVALTPDSEKAVDVEVPTKTSDLNNDSGFITGFTETDPTVPSWAKQPNKPSYQYSEISNTPDLSDFITKSVNDLTNYYLKSETYTKAEVAALIGAIQQFHYEIYPTLPASGESNVLYLIGPTGSGSDKYEEYVYSNSTFTKIGDTSIDLSGYVTTSALNTALASYATTQDLDDSKVFWAEVDVTTFAEIQDAVDAGRTVMLKDEDGYIYAFSYIEDTYVVFTSLSGEECSIRTYNVWDNDSYELFTVYNIESQDHKVHTISSSSDGEHYPSAYAVYQALQSYTPTSQLATVATSGDYDDLINKPTIPQQEVFWATYGTTTAAEIDAAVAAGKMVMCKDPYGFYYILTSYNQSSSTIGFLSGYSTAARYILVRRSNDTWVGGSYTIEMAGNKVSTITGYETNTTKYPNTKAVADALGKWGVVSQTITWSGNNQNAIYTLSNITNGLIPFWVIEQAAVYGVTFNETSGYFEYCGYTDIAADEMKKVLGRRIGVLTATAYASYELRILLPGSKGTSNQQSVFQAANRLIEIPAFYGADCNIGGYSFYSCWLLKRINLQLDGNSSALSTDSLFGNCVNLEYVNINKLKVNLKLQGSPNITLICMVNTVTRANNTSAITITLHANAYARCQADTTEYTYSGNTYTGILALATAHNITIASA